MIHLTIHSRAALLFAPRLLVFVLVAACGGSDTASDPLPVETPRDVNPSSNSGSAGERMAAAATSGRGGTGGAAAAPAGSGGSASKPAADGGKGGAAAPSGGRAGTSSNAGASGGGAGAGMGGHGGVGGAGAGGSTSVNLDVPQIAANIAKALCDALEMCVGPSKLAMLTGREDCVARFTASLVQDEFGTLASSIETGAVKLDTSRLDACYTDTRALGCAVQTQRLPASCQEALAAQRAIGESCSLDAECSGDAFCSLEETCPRTCQTTRAEGQPCTRDPECRRGAICNGGTCAAPASEDEACAGDSGNACMLGTSCVGSTDVLAGVCKANAGVQTGAFGDACTPGGELCMEGLSCAYDSGAFKCFSAAKRGETCRLALPSQCPSDTYCDAPDVTLNGTCVALPGDGEQCVLNDECAPGHVCITQAGIPTCRKLGDLGDSCLTGPLCRSGVCSNGSCKLRERCE